MSVVIIVVILGAVAFGVYRAVTDPEGTAYGPLKPAVLCAHCQTRGQVRMKSVKRKQGISGAKATGAVLTGGLSVVATGLAKKTSTTQARCGHCRTVWHID